MRGETASDPFALADIGFAFKISPLLSPLPCGVWPPPSATTLAVGFHSLLIDPTLADLTPSPTVTNHDPPENALRAPASWALTFEHTRE